MSITSKITTLAAPSAMLLLAGCGPMAFKADVSRFQQLPAPAGQTFIVQAANPRLQGGIEFSQYADLVEQRLTQQGYRAAEGGQANLIVTIDYGVDNGHTQIVSRPGYGGWGGYGGFGYGGFGYGGFGPGWGYGGLGRRGFYGRGWYGGWADPFWYQPFGYPQVDSYTVYLSHLDMRIRGSGDGRTLFEGRARARSTDDSLPRLVPNLVEAMFTGFPGRSGEDVLITVPPPPKPGGQAPINRGG